MRIRLGLLLSSLAGLGGGVADAATPMDLPLREDAETHIECELAQAPRSQDVPVFHSSRDAEQARGVYHYRLWLPPGYLADPARRWPCLFIASAGGAARMGNMAGWIRERGCIAVMLVESRNRPWPPIVGNFLAAHDDAVRRMRIQEGLKMATGMSGGARASSLFVQLRPGFSGLVLQAAGFAQGENGAYLVEGVRRNPAMAVAILMGTSDRNRSEAAGVAAALGPRKSLILEFDGGHTWAPAETFARAMAWIEEQVLTQGPAARP